MSGMFSVRIMSPESEALKAWGTSDGEFVDTDPWWTNTSTFEVL